MEQKWVLVSVSRVTSFVCFPLEALRREGPRLRENGLTCGIITFIFTASESLEADTYVSLETQFENVAELSEEESFELSGLKRAERVRERTLDEGHRTLSKAR